MVQYSEVVGPVRLGVGLGLRSEYYQHILENKPPVPWFEALTENYLGSEGKLGSRPFEILWQVRKEYPVVLHGVSLSIGSSDPLNSEYLRQLKELAEAIEPAWISDHLCWTGVDRKSLHDLLPLPYTQEAIVHVSERILRVQDTLRRRLTIENVSSYLSFTHSEMEEWDFLNEIAKRADCSILLDINNIFVSSLNHGFDPKVYIDAITAERVRQFHLAGHQRYEDYAIDTHDHPVCEQVWQLYSHALKKFGPIPTLIEWDAKLPAFEVLEEERLRAERIQEQICGKHHGKCTNHSAKGHATVAAMDLHQAAGSA